MAVKIKSGLILFLLVLAIASFFRLWQIKQFPGGLFPDEAANGLDIVDYIFKGQHSPFFERGLGRESLFFYLQAASVVVFGIGVWQMHLVPALVGILTVVSLWFLAKKIFNAKVAFWSSVFMASSAWHVTHSRTGFRAIMVPLFSTLFFYFTYSAFKEISPKKRLLFSILSGISLGLGLYTYISFRLMGLVIAIFVVCLFLINKNIFKAYFKEISLGLLALFLVIAPLAVYFINHPDSFVGRAGYVSIFNPDQNKGDLLGTFLSVAEKTALMFFTDGDQNWRHNPAGYPMLTPWVSAFFALGIIYSLLIILFNILKRKVFNKDYLQNWFVYFFLIVWFLGQLLPELLTAEGIPHGLRAIGAIPPVFLLSAIGLDFFFKKMSSLLNLKIISNALIILFLGLILATNLIYDYYLYFGISVNSPGFYYDYRSDLTVVSDYLNQRSLKEKTYLVLDPYSVQTPEFLTAGKGRPYILLDPAASYKTHLAEGEQIVFTQSTIFDANKFEEFNPQVDLAVKKYNQFNEEIMRVYAQ